MFTKEETKQEVKRLIEFYNSNKDSFKERNDIGSHNIFFF